VLWDETGPGGGYSARVLPKGSIIRLADLEGDACASVLLFSAMNTAERLNIADTVKVQWQAYLGPGALLLSDMGRVLCTIVTDTSRRHDALCGCSNRRMNERRFGNGAISGPTPNARDLFVLAGAKRGLTRRDIAPSLSFFKGVRVADDGALQFDGSPTGPCEVELRAEMTLLFLVVNSPHPLDERPVHMATTLRVTAWTPAYDDVRGARTQLDTPERVRAFENTDDDAPGARR
jgi:urea carboxylase-associated protein 2